MEIKPSIAAQFYAAAKPATRPQERDATTSAEGFTNAISDFAQTLQKGEDTAKAAMVGGADPHALIEALAATELAVETAVTVRDKVVEAYQEILRMPV